MIDTRYKAFGKDWFKRKQHILLYFLNHKVLKIPMRYLLGITEKDVDKKEYICEIRPNGFTVFVDRKQNTTQYRSQFYTNDFHSVCIYLNLKQVWLLMHKWDELFAEQYLPELSFGFPTLTVYPDEDPETNTVDGFCALVGSLGGVSWNGLITGNGTTADSSSTTITMKLSAYISGNEYDYLSRGVCLFDTSSLPSDFVVTSATLSAYGSGTLTTDLLGKEDTETLAISGTSDIASDTTIAASDYQGMLPSKGTDYGNTDFATLSTSSYNDITLTSAGEALIKDDGVTYFGFIFGWDWSGTFGGTWGASLENVFTLYSADYTGGNYGPKLVVNYTSVSGGGGLSMII